MPVVFVAPSILTLSGGGVPAPSFPIVRRAYTRDMEDTGRYRIPGPRWVKEKALPANVPLRRRVQLYNQRSNRLVRETWSDAVTGEYAFDNIRGGDGTTYFIVAFDHLHNYRAVLADNITPELMT